MPFAEIHALRLACDQASEAYLTAQALLLLSIEGACIGLNPWPTPEDYGEVAALGRTAAQTLRRYLSYFAVRWAPPRNAADRAELIQRLSRAERLWQPSPEAWLQQQDTRR